MSHKVKITIESNGDAPTSYPAVPVEIEDPDSALSPEIVGFIQLFLTLLLRFFGR